MITIENPVPNMGQKISPLAKIFTKGKGFLVYRKMTLVFYDKRFLNISMLTQETIKVQLVDQIKT